MQQATTEAKSAEMRTVIGKPKPQVTEQQKRAAEAQKAYEKLLKDFPELESVLNEPEDEPEEPVQQPQEKVYSLEQLSIALCCESLQQLIETMAPGAYMTQRVRQARYTLFYLGGMSEFIPPPPQQQPAPAPAADEEKEPAEPDEFLLDEDRLVDAKDVLGGLDTRKDLDKISEKLKAMDEDTIMKEQAPVKKETGIRGLIQKLSTKKPEEKEVSAEHQPVSLG